MKKQIKIGTTVDGNFYAFIKIKDGKLSITGVVGPYLNGNAKGGCGQVSNYTAKDFIEFSEGWSESLTNKFFEVWNRWHLNDMRAGLPEQEDFIREWRKTNDYDFSKASQALKEAGLNPLKDYKYGSAWLEEELPFHILGFLTELPADKTYLGTWSR